MRPRLRPPLSLLRLLLLRPLSLLRLRLSPLRLLRVRLRCRRRLGERLTLLRPLLRSLLLLRLLLRSAAAAAGDADRLRSRFLAPPLLSSSPPSAAGDAERPPLRSPPAGLRLRLAGEPLPRCCAGEALRSRLMLRPLAGLLLMVGVIEVMVGDRQTGVGKRSGNARQGQWWQTETILPHTCTVVRGCAGRQRCWAESLS